MGKSRLAEPTYRNSSRFCFFQNTCMSQMLRWMLQAAGTAAVAGNLVTGEGKREWVQPLEAAYSQVESLSIQLFLWLCNL